MHTTHSQVSILTIWFFSVLAAGAMALALVGCQGSGAPPFGEIPAGDAGVPRPDFAASPECTQDQDCGSGVCVANRCCASAERACGDTCCNAGQTCFANACVDPGRACLAVADCNEDEYCEPGLAAEGALPPAGDPPQHACVQPAPSPGRCLALPPRCPEGDDRDDCLPSCEVRSEPGALAAREEWSWSAASAQTFKDHVDVWSTPVVGRVTDSNCDGRVDELDPPNVIFVAGDAKGTCCQCTTDAVSACHTGVLRVLDGNSGKEVFSLRRAHDGSAGFMGTSPAIGDINGDGSLEIAAVTAEGYVVLLDRQGKLLSKSDVTLPGSDSAAFGWGGGLALGDMDSDGHTEVVYGATVYTTIGGKLTHRFTGEAGLGGTGAHTALSLLADVDDDGQLELVVGNAVYEHDGTLLWRDPARVDAFVAIADFDGDGKAEVVAVHGGQITIADGRSGKLRAGPFTLPGAKHGGPPTVADFDGDGKMEIGVAKDLFYTVVDVDLSAGEGRRMTQLWAQANHDLSSSVTGSTVFDFEGDGAAEVIYNDECFLWVYDGKTGAVRFATPTNSFTGTEASLVADVDGDGRAEILMIANRASPSAWKCDMAPWNAPDPILGRPAWTPPAGYAAHSGVAVWGDRHNAWVGTRTLWNQHAYHVANICDDRDSACEESENRYGAIPRRQKRSWEIPWLNSFRQNVQDKGIFDAPDAAMLLRVECRRPLTLRATLKNRGRALLPVGVKVGFYVQRAGSEELLGTATSTGPVFPGRALELVYEVADGEAGVAETFVAKVLGDGENTHFAECRSDNNVSPPARSGCLIE